MEQQLNSSTGFWANDDRRDEDDFKELSQTDAKPLVSGCLPDLESVEFFDLMQQYRIAPMTNQQMVIDAFEAVKDWLRANSH